MFYKRQNSLVKSSLLSVLNRLIVGSLLLFLSYSNAYAQAEIEWRETVLEVADTEIPVWQVRLPNGSDIHSQLLWVPSEYGVLPAEKKIAEQLAEQGVAVTFFDPFEVLFLAPTSSALKQVPSEWLESLINGVAFEGDTFNALVASNQASALAIKALNEYFYQKRLAIGLILINPDLMTHTPVPGEEANYWPQVSQLNLPTVVLQAELSPWRWQLPALQKKLSQGGAEVFLKLLPSLRDRFYFRPDADNYEQQYTQKFAKDLLQAMDLIKPYLHEFRQTQVALASSDETSQPVSKQLSLKPYQGQQALRLQLPDTHNRPQHLSDYVGKVVLVNFWASWCPPCVHEMPSMAALKSQLQDQGFEILAVNLGEDPKAIAQFTQEHALNFPVLLDQQGEAVQEWKVMAYPSSYIVDKQGQIRYALFGAIDWQGEDSFQKLQKLLEE